MCECEYKSSVRVQDQRDQTSTSTSMRTRARCFDRQTERKTGSNHTQSKNDSSHSTHKSSRLPPPSRRRPHAFQRIRILRVAIITLAVIMTLMITIGIGICCSSLSLLLELAHARALRDVWRPLWRTGRQTVMGRRGLLPRRRRRSGRKTTRPTVVTVVRPRVVESGIGLVEGGG